MKKLFLAFLLALLSAPAFGQSQTVRQSGNVTARHPACWTAWGVIQDCGTAAVPFASSLGTLGEGPTICANSAVTTGPYNRLCLAANTSSAAQLSLQNVGGASPQALEICTNGSCVTFPSSISGSLVTTSLPTVANSIPIFSGTTGILGDSGLRASGTTVTTGIWNGTAVALGFGGTGATSASGARTNLGLGSMATQAASSVAITGGTITGMPTPSASTDVANKSYVDGISSGVRILASSKLATAAVLPNSPTYSNGASGVGATLTAGSNTTLTVDGVVAALADVILVKNQAAPAQNGIYTVTTVGSGAAAWVLTRATYFDAAAEMLAGSYTLVTAGTANTNTSWTLATTVTTVGTDPATFNQFSGSGVASINGLAGAVSIGTGLTTASGSLNTTIGISPIEFYVSATGNDSADCLTSSGNATNGPCLTIAHAVDVAVSNYDAMGRVTNINVGAGTFNGFSIFGPLRGSATGDGQVKSLQVLGAGSGSTTISDTQSTCGAIIASSHADLLIGQMTVTKASGCSNNGSVLFVQEQAIIQIGTDVILGAAGSGGQLVHAEGQGLVEASFAFGITGAGVNAFAVATGGVILLSSSVTCTGALAFPQGFLFAQSGGSIVVDSVISFTGCGSVTGPQFVVEDNGIIDFQGISSSGRAPGNSGGRAGRGGVVAPPQAMTIGTCTNGSLASGSTAQAMSISFSGTSSSCQLSFDATKTTTPACVASSNTGGNLAVFPSVSTVVVTGSFGNGTLLSILCQGLPY